MDKNHLQDKAKRLLKAGTLLPIAAASSAQAVSLSLDFAGTGLYDNSGFFASDVTPAAGVGGSTLGLGFKLFGSDSLSDSAFYADFGSGLEPRFDGDGLGFMWGGTINGAFEDGDRLVAPFEYSFDFTHTSTGEFDVPFVYSTLTIGVFNDFGSPVNFGEQGSVGEFSFSSSEQFFGESYETPGAYNESNTIELELFGEEEATHWAAILSVYVEHENDSSNFDGPPFPKLNGDVLNVTVPQNSIDLDIVPINPVPEPSVGFLAALAGLFTLRRRR